MSLSHANQSPAGSQLPRDWSKEEAMSTDQKVIVRYPTEESSSQPILALLDQLLTPDSVVQDAHPTVGTGWEDEARLDGLIRSAICGLPGW